MSLNSTRSDHSSPEVPSSVVAGALLAALTAAGTALAPVPAHALTTLEYTNPITGQSDPQGSAPFLRVEISDEVIPGVDLPVVKIVVANTTTSPSYNTMTGVVFNLKDTTGLSLSGSCTPTLGTVACVPDNFSNFNPNSIGLASGPQTFDFRLNLPSPNPDDPSISLGPSDVATFVFFLINTGSGTFNADSFNAQTDGYTSLAGVGAIGGDSANTSVICVSTDASCPQPKTESVPTPLPLMGAAAFFTYSRKIRNRISAS